MGRITMSQGKGSLMHNRRDYAKINRPMPAHIDTARTGENIVLINKDVKAAYHEIFDAAVAEYNAKQKQPSRRIKDYCKKIQESGNGEKLFYEDVVQWGTKDDSADLETRQKAKDALIAYVEGFLERNPNLRLIGAYIHMDEASPHLHLDYIPVATGYKNGMSVRNSLDRAMKEMGYVPEGLESRQNNATMVWKEHERAVFGNICRQMGLEVDAERKSRGTLSVAEYKDAKEKMMSGLIREEKELKKKIAPLRQFEVDSREIDIQGKPMPKGYRAVKSDELNTLKNQAKAYLANRDEIESLRDRSVELNRREQELDGREQELDGREQEVKRMEQEVEQKQQTVELMYHRQENLNHVLEKSESREGKLKTENSSLKAEINGLKAENSTLKSENSSLNDSITELKDKLLEVKITLTERIRDAVLHIGVICKAVSMLKYDRADYRVKLTPKQSRLIDAISNYASRYARSVGEPEIADDINRNIGISEGINDEIKRLNRKYKNRDFER